MRRAIIPAIKKILAEDDRAILLLAGVGGYAFEGCRMLDLGICEQGVIGFAAGMARMGWRPIVYGIAPFVIERAFEQIKLDIGYQGRNVKIVSVGGSYDYATAGPTHHCPGDVPALYNVPGLNIYVPSCGKEAARILEDAMQDDAPAYIRLTDAGDFDYPPLPMGHLYGLLYGTDAAVVAVGSALPLVLEAVDGLDVDVYYTNTVTGVDFSQLEDLRVLLVEPYYTTLAGAISEANPESLTCLAPAREWRHEYGTRDDLHEHAGLTVAHIRAELEALIG